MAVQPHPTPRRPPPHPSSLQANQALVRAFAAAQAAGNDADAFAVTALDLLRAARAGPGAATPPRRPPRGGAPAPVPLDPSVATPVNLATALHRLGMLSRRRRPPEPGSAPWRLLSAAAAAPAASRFDRWPPRSVSNALWGVAQCVRSQTQAAVEEAEADAAGPPRAGGAARRGSALPRPLQDLALAGMASFAANPLAFNSQEASTVAWAAAVLGVGDAATWRALGDGAAASLASLSAEYQPQGVSMIAYALGRARFRHEGALDAAAGIAAARASAFPPQAHANLAWALAVLRHPPPPGLLEEAAAVLVAAAPEAAATRGGAQVRKGGSGEGGADPAAAPHAAHLFSFRS